MEIKKVWDAIRSITSFENATNFLYQFPDYGKDMILPDCMDYSNCITAMLILRFPQDILFKTAWDGYLEKTSKIFLDSVLNEEDSYISNFKAETFMIVLKLWKKQDKKSFLEYLSTNYLITKNQIFLICQNLFQFEDKEKQKKEEQLKNLYDYLALLTEKIEGIDVEYLSTFLSRNGESIENDKEKNIFVSQNAYQVYWGYVSSEIRNQKYDLMFKNLHETINCLNKTGGFEFDIKHYKKIAEENNITREELLSLADSITNEFSKRKIEMNYILKELDNWKTAIITQKISESLIQLLKLTTEMSSRLNLKLFIETQLII